MFTPLKYGFSSSRLNEIADALVSKRIPAGTDRITHAQFNKIRSDEIQIIEKKVIKGDYRFTRYRPLLKSRGANKLPRELHVPTIRDRITLKALLDILQRDLGNAIDRTLPNEKIRSLGRYIQNNQSAELQIARLDIKSFFDSISHARLREKLAKVSSNETIALIEKAFTTTATPNTLRTRGIPQGISISTALADAYLMDLPDVFSKSQSTWVRHVDDIIIIGPDAIELAANVDNYLQYNELEVNQDKTEFTDATTGVDFLGYHLSRRGISIARTSGERLLTSINKIIATHLSHRSGYDRISITQQSRQGALLHEINKRISGVIHNQRHFGWMMYFSESDDISILKELDSHIRNITRRAMRPNLHKQIKSLVRTYFSFKFTRRDGYIKNFDMVTTSEQRRAELVVSGTARPDDVASMTEARVNTIYDDYIEQSLRDLERDIGVSS